MTVRGASNTHGDGGLPSARLAGDENGPTGDVPIFDHLENETCCPTGSQLADHPLGHLQGEASHQRQTLVVGTMRSGQQIRSVRRELT